MENIIEETLKANIKNVNNRFVFPTQMAADLWADRATLTCGVTAVAMERFMAWDDFKGNSIKSKQKNRKSIPSVMRTVFSTLLLEENKKNPFIKKLIGPEFSKEAGGFTNWITSLLPSLSLWKKHVEESKAVLDEEDKDLMEIYEKYSMFLDENGFFDPAWETPPFQSDGNRYFIFFPEILSDYAEYKEILETTEDVEIVSLTENYLPSIAETEKLPVANFYSDSRSELKSVAIKLRKLHEEKNIRWEDMCISVPDMESYGRYIERELELYRIPHVIRFARPLDSTGAGNFFAQVKECVTSGFTFDTLRNLLLNLELPWKDRESINQLIEFGKNNNCICSYSYNGKDFDVWEESFKTDISENRAKEFYRTLRRHLTALVNAEKFTSIREEYFKFRNFAFDMEKCSPSTDRTISRCISELGGLIDIETEYPKYALPSPFSFFTEQLSSIKYLEQTDNLGVRVLTYKTAACAPFGCHIIVDASQSSLSVIYKPLSFLRDDKRKIIFKNQEDPNVTQHFIMLYKMNSLDSDPVYSAASKTFTGYSQVCSYLNEQEVLKENISRGYYDTEKNWLEKKDSKSAPMELTDISKNGFDFWKKCQKLSGMEGNDSVKTTDIQNRINRRFASKNNEKKIQISASSLKKFYTCPRIWVENNIAGLDEPVNEASLIDGFAQGALNHKILELYFSRLRENKLEIRTTGNGLEEKYTNILLKAVDDAIEMQTKTPMNSNGNSFIATELINATKNVLVENMISVINSFSEISNGFTVVYTEEKLSYDDPEKDYVLEGYVDLVISDGEENFIIDYKRNSTPKLLYEDGTIAIRSESAEDSETPVQSDIKGPSNIPDFQMPAYLYLLEKSKGIKAENCAFFSMGSKEIVPVVGQKVFDIHKGLHPKTKLDVYTLEDFEPTMKLFQQKTDEYYHRIRNGDFSISDSNQNFEMCNNCTFRALCRRTFNVSRKN